MRIAVNASTLQTEELEGYGFFIEEVFSRIISMYPEHEFYFLYNHPPPQKLFLSNNFKELIVKPYFGFKQFAAIGNNRQIAAVLKKINADVFISIDVKRLIKTNVPQCVVIHNLPLLKQKPYLLKTQRKLNIKYTGNNLATAAVIVTTSENSKQNIQELFQLPAAKIHVVQHAASSLFQPIAYEEKEKMKWQYAAGNEYFMYSNFIHADKNIYTLLKAFSVFKKKQKSNMKLLITGHTTFKTAGIIKQLHQFKYRDEVKIIEYINKETIAQLVAGAYAEIYFSDNEHFGLPAFEAMQCQVPAIVTGTGLVKEIGGNAFLYTANSSFEELAGQMMLLYKDENLRAELIENGKKRTAQYSWNTAAEKIWNCILQTSIA